MKIGDQALVALADARSDAEKTRSKYWEENMRGIAIDASGNLSGSAPLGNVSRKRAWPHRLVHWILQNRYRAMGREYRHFSELYKMGSLIARRQKRAYTPDMVQQVLSLALIREHLDFAEGDVSAVIGDGYGVMTALVLMAFPERKAIVVNLTTPLLADLTFAKHALPDRTIALVATPDEMAEALASPEIQIIAVRADHASCLAAAPIGIAINIASMQEMDKPVISDYFRILRGNRADETVFYCSNHVGKRNLEDEVIRFHDYPWDDEDRVIVDGLSPWRNTTYRARPPFYQTKSTAWHRLVALKQIDS